MGSRPRLVTARFSKLPSALNTRAISHSAGVAVSAKHGVAQSVPVN
jgi:hypothetical protein